MKITSTLLLAASALLVTANEDPMVAMSPNTTTSDPDLALEEYLDHGNNLE